MMRKSIIIAAIAVVLVAIAACVGFTSEQPHGDLKQDIAIEEIRIEFANSYLVYNRANPREALLIDTGIPENAEKLAARILDAGVDPRDLDAVILTHGHYDHAGGARFFQESFDTMLIAGRGDQVPLETGEELGVCPTSWLARRIASQSAEPGTWTSSPTVYVDDRLDLSTISNIGGEIIVLPGHTPGSLIVNVGDATFVGDQIRGKIFGSGPALHFFMCDLADNARDLDEILSTLSPNAERFFPGHMSVFSREALRRYVDHRLEEIRE
ncbi:MAG: MBL fold metallo-hydrolase [Pseudomonadota bacterium]